MTASSKLTCDQSSRGIHRAKAGRGGQALAIRLTVHGVVAKLAYIRAKRVYGEQALHCRRLTTDTSSSARVVVRLQHAHNTELSAGQRDDAHLVGAIELRQLFHMARHHVRRVDLSPDGIHSARPYLLERVRNEVVGIRRR